MVIFIRKITRLICINNMKKLVRLTESDLHRIVKESVDRILSETSTDTVDACCGAAYKKYQRAKSQYASNDPRVQKAKNQVDFFNKEIDKRYEEGNDAKKARIVQNREDRRNGSRKYKSGIGWRTEKNKD